jgi:hypothetical protein
VLKLVAAFAKQLEIGICIVTTVTVTMVYRPFSRLGIGKVLATAFTVLTLCADLMPPTTEVADTIPILVIRLTDSVSTAFTYTNTMPQPGVQNFHTLPVSLPCSLGSTGGAELGRRACWHKLHTA